MVRTQIQLPDEIYREAKRIARQREMSLAEVVRRGLEHMAHLYPPIAERSGWALPEAQHLGEFQTPARDWRELANEPSRGGADDDVVRHERPAVRPERRLPGARGRAGVPRRVRRPR